MLLLSGLLALAPSLIARPLLAARGQVADAQVARFRVTGIDTKGGIGRVRIAYQQQHPEGAVRGRGVAFFAHRFKPFHGGAALGVPLGSRDLKPGNGRLTLDVDLKAMNLKPGDQLCIAARWPTGHEWGSSGFRGLNTEVVVPSYRLGRPRKNTFRVERIDVSADLSQANVLLSTFQSSYGKHNDGRRVAFSVRQVGKGKAVELIPVGACDIGRGDEEHRIDVDLKALGLKPGDALELVARWSSGYRFVGKRATLPGATLDDWGRRLVHEK
ncbi:MAG: hypothetical protein H6707_01435 [Deltaproteobacteria bacterium]|nr:hypothetical protein [Deltaproteobacteria bacterium]